MSTVKQNQLTSNKIILNPTVLAGKLVPVISSEILRAIRSWNETFAKLLPENTGFNNPYAKTKTIMLSKITVNSIPINSIPLKVIVIAHWSYRHY